MSLTKAADAYKGKYELNAKSAFRYVMDNLRGKKYTIIDTGEQVEISQVGAKKLTSHARYTEDYLQSFVAIPDIIESGIFLGEEENAKVNKKYDKYRYYACGLKIGNEDYTVRCTVGKRNGNWYYDQALTKIEKGELVERVRKQISLSSVNNSPYGFVDNRLLELLQEKISEKEINSAWENVDSVIEAAEREVYAEQKAAVSDADKRIEADKQKFFSEGIDGIEETGDEYSREWYEQNRLRDGETYVGEYVSPNFGDGIVLAVDVDGKREYKTYVGEGVEYDGTFDSIENAARDLLGRAWDEKFEEQGGRSYYEDSEADNSKPDVSRRCFEKAMERLGIKIVRKDFARTGSEYLYLKLPNRETMKARFADHKQVYSADISVEDDWKAAVKYVVDVAHKWNDEYEEGDVRFSRGAKNKREEMSFNGAIRRKKWKPTDAEIKEVERQIKEVKAKWTNPDGTMKKGYHCAPNGKPSKLSEEQWLWVRTPNFKKWFGDWESLAEAYPENEIFDIDEAYKFARKNLQGGSFTSKDGYGATLGREGIDKMNSGLARGKTANNRLHALAFANIGKLFGNSELLETEPPRDGNTNIKRYLKFYAPLYMDGLYAVKITVKELSGNNGNRMYSIEGLDITKESEYRGQSRGSKENSIPADYSDSVNNFVKKLREVKGKVSQVVDENGEPLVVFHNTPNKFTVFKPSERGRFGRDIYATSNPEDTSYSEKWNMMALFANARKLRNPMEKVPVEFLRKLQKQAEDYLLKNPPEVFVGKKEAMLDFYFGKNRNEIFQHSFGSLYWNNLRDTLDQVNDVLGSNFSIDADGFVVERENGGKWFNFFDRSQVKSAINNVGTYNRETPDIRTETCLVIIFSIFPLTFGSIFRLCLHSRRG